MAQSSVIKMTATDRQPDDTDKLLVEIHKIRPLKNQPRDEFDERDLHKLAQSIKLVGQKEPITVRKIGAHEFDFEIINGERRLRACRIGGIRYIWVVVDDDKRLSNPNYQHLSALVSNFNAKAHNCMEVSNALKKQVDAGEKVKDLAVVLGKSEPWVYQHLGLQRLHPSLQKLTNSSAPEGSKIGLAVGYHLSKLAHKQQLKAYQELKESGAKSRVMEARILAAKYGVESPEGEPPVRQRKPSDDIRIFTRFVTRLYGGAQTVMDMKNSVFKSLIANRKPKEIESMLKKMRQGADDLLELCKIIEGLKPTS